MTSYSNQTSDPAADAAKTAEFLESSDVHTRAKLLEALARMLEQHRDELVSLANEETYLGLARLNGELDRTSFQLRKFAEHLGTGALPLVEEDLPISGPAPYGRPSMHRSLVPLGPVAVFSASNFPFAFSVLGGDTASALAAGCPVVVRAHPAHPKLSVRIHGYAQETLTKIGLPQGILGLVVGDSIELGAELARHPAIKAVAFTGSTRGGLALEAIAAARTPPIPFFGELGSVNPLVILPGALTGSVGPLAQMLAGSVALGMGQFCTRPGIVALAESDDSEAFVAELAEHLGQASIHQMLTPGIEHAYRACAAAIAAVQGTEVLLSPSDERSSPLLAMVDADVFLAQSQLRHEVFGPAVVVVKCSRDQQLSEIVRAVSGSLTVTLWGADKDTPLARELVVTATRSAGRVLFGGVPTGVAVTRAQHHGGPWPASTQPGTTSVGIHAYERFLRPVVYQSAPNWLFRTSPHEPG